MMTKRFYEGLRTWLLISSMFWLLVIWALVGCAQVIIERKPMMASPDYESEPVLVYYTLVKVNTLLKDIDFERLDVPGIVGLTKYAGESPDVTVITPGGIVETGE